MKQLRQSYHSGNSLPSSPVPLIDRVSGRLYSSGMSKEPAFKQELKRLEERLQEVLDLCGRLQEENLSLRESQDRLVEEKASLVQRNEQVRTRVEHIITRLRSLEQSS